MENFERTPFKFRHIDPEIKTNQKYIDNVNEAKFKTGYPRGVYWTFDFIELISDYIDFDEIKTIFDVGSRDCHQSVEFRNWFPDARIVAFEANPGMIDICNSVASGYDIEVIPMAASNYNGTADFYVCQTNVGGSSLLQISNHKRSCGWKQRKVSVECTRIDDWCSKNDIESIDILWVDVQGAEQLVFEGCDAYLDNVKAICTEVELDHMYQNSILKNELDQYLEERGFVQLKAYHMDFTDKRTYHQIVSDLAECDVTYINKKYLKT